MNVRRWRRNATTAAVTVPALAAGYALSGVERPVEALSFATAYVALGLLTATLCIGPLNLLRAAPNPVSTHLRRDLGVSAAAMGTAHTIFGLQVHKNGELAGYFLLSGADGWMNTSVAFIVSNYMGALAVIVLLMLLSVSNDYSLRRLGTRRWKRVQRWSYAAIVLVALHGAIYQALEKRVVGAVLLFAVLVAIVLYFQLRGFVLSRRRRPGG